MATGLKTWQIGDVKVTRVLEQEAPLPPEGLIANIDPVRLAEHSAWLKPHFMNDDGQIILSIHALVVESGGKTIVVDTCMGNDRPLPQGMGPFETRFLEDLETHAFDPPAIGFQDRQLVLFPMNDFIDCRDPPQLVNDKTTQRVEFVILR